VKHSEGWKNKAFSTILFTIDCVVPEKNPNPPHGRSLEIPRGRRV